MRLVRFSTAGGPPRLGAVLGRWDHWEKIVDLSAVDSAIPADTLEFVDACPGLKGDVWDRSLQVLRSEEHTSELQSQSNLVCRLLLEKKNTHVQVEPGSAISSEERRPVVG